MNHTDSAPSHYSRRTRIGLLILLVVTILFAGGALFVKYKLEGLRAVVQQEVESRTGAKLQAGRVVVNGLRGLRVDDAAVTFESPGSPVVQCDAPVAYVYINIADLLYGQISIERIETENAMIRVGRRADRPWIATEGDTFKQDSRLLSPPSFRVIGRQCTLELLNVVGDTRLQITDLGFDISRLTGSPDITAKLNGKIGPGADSDLKVDLRFTSMEDFSLGVHSGAIAADDINVFLPASQRFIKSGVASPNLRVAGYPDGILVLALEAPFDELTVRGQPDFIRPIRGTIRGMASYDATKRLLTLTTAKAESDQLAGRVEGSISFDAPGPVFDLRLDATRLPISEALSYVLQGRADAYGTYDFTPQEPYQIYATLQGTVEAPEIAFHASAGGGQFAFTANDTSLPQVNLQLGGIALAWTTDTSIPTGSFTVTDGTLMHAASGLKAQKVSGVLAVENQRITMDPLNAEVMGSPFVGRMRYDMDSGRMELTANGVLPNLEETMFGASINVMSVSGSAAVHCNVVKSADRYVVEADLDATQAEIGYRPWFIKARGVGADVKKVHIEVIPNRTLSVEAEANVASSDFTVATEMYYRKNTWQLGSVTGTADRIDVDGIGKCLRIPYKVSGGAGTDTKFEWRREAGEGNAWQMKASSTFDALSLFPEGGQKPMVCEGVRMEVEMTGPADPKGTLRVHAKKGRMPAIRDKWFASLKNDSKENPNLGAKWTFDLAADALDAPPWKGTKFAGTAYARPSEAGLDTFAADVDGGGHVQGSYRSFKQDNTYELTLQWTSIPAVYLLDQLDYPHVLNGTTTGEIRYTLDRDDPGTLKGRGHFEVREGLFSADFILSQLQGRLESKLSSLPSSLKFTQLKSDFVLDRDVVKTPNLQLASEGLRVTGQGQFVLHGDMDYDLKVAVSPSLAEKIPALRDNFNVQGLRLAQQDVELAFKVKGPTFNPQGELAEFPPLGITLVSSALEVTSDAMKVIDIPRKILADLLKIGGGIVGMK